LKVCGAHILTSKYMPACWSVSVLKRLLFVPLTALEIAVWGPSPEGVLVLAMKLPSLSWDSPETGALLEPGGTTGVVTDGVIAPVDGLSHKPAILPAARPPQQNIRRSATYAPFGIKHARPERSGSRPFIRTWCKS
jgi:hypothetical protein